jgi:hypothetical protein
MSAEIFTAFLLRHCSCAASVCPKLYGGEKLVWQIFFLHFIWRIFYHQNFTPIGLQKTNAASGWLVKKYLSVNNCDFLLPTDDVTENPQNIWPLRNITNPSGWDGVKKYYRH